MSLYYEWLICHCIMRDSYVSALRGIHMSLYYEGLLRHCIMRDSYAPIL